MKTKWRSIKHLYLEVLAIVCACFIVIVNGRILKKDDDEREIGGVLRDEERYERRRRLR
jgi:hypothetical protein